MLDLVSIQKLRVTVTAFHVDAQALLARGRQTILHSRALLAGKPVPLVLPDHEHQTKALR